jgi:hypothetical protein
VKRALVVAGVALAVAASPRAAHAWATTEHQEIGAASYLGACAAVEAMVAAEDGGARERFELACGRNRAVLARLYGDATAIAGDFVGHPSELLSPTGAWRFQSRKHYFLLALENSSHFNPMATQSWREHHLSAVEHAVVAARAEGIRRIEAWEEAVRESAFADHLLQDSFASGHMGFNRRASSAAAAKSFHDFWNARGRTVRDAAGRSWTTYGDGKLDDGADQAGRRHVIDAATLSVRDVLLTFVLGREQPAEGFRAWESLPFAVEAPELLVDAAGLVAGGETARGGAEVPLIATVLPARKNTVARARVWTFAPFSDESGGPTVAATANVELAVPVIPAQTSLGAGATLRERGGGHSALVEGGVLVPLGLSLDGLLSHEVEAAAAVVLRKEIATVIHVEYQLNVELGTSLLTARVGLAELAPAWQVGWTAALGYGLVFSAAGGGSF